MGVGFSRRTTKQSDGCLVYWVTAPESRAFYQVRAAGASVQRFVSGIGPLLIPGTDAPKKCINTGIIIGIRVFVVEGGKVTGQAQQV
jgi:hypothetical protein